MMDYLPPGNIVKIGDPRWRRWAIQDGTAQWWCGKQRRWRDNPSEAVLFCREMDAIEARNRCCLGDAGDTFAVTVSIVTYAGRWSRKALAAFLKRHKEFFVKGPAGKEGMLLEILPRTLRKVVP